MRSSLKSLFLCALTALLYGLSPLSSAATISFSPSPVSCGSAAVGGYVFCTFTVTVSGGSVEFNLQSNNPWTVSPSSWSVYGAAVGNAPACTGGFSGFTLSSSRPSCGFQATFSPTALGSSTASFQITNWAIAPLSNPTLTLTGTGVGPSTSVVISGLNCPTTAVGSTSTCSATNAYLQTNGSTFTTNSPPVTISPASDFSIAAGSCTGSVFGSCSLGLITFHPTGIGTRSATVTSSTSQPAGSTATLSGTATGGTASIGVSGVVCSAAAGFTVSCSGTATVSASGGQVTLNAIPVNLSGTNSSEFAVAAGSCAGAVLPNGGSCSLGTVTFSPAATGTRSVTLTASVASGAAGSGTPLTGNATADGIATVSSVTCPTTTVVGGSSACTGTVTVTATGGPIKLSAASVYAATGSTGAFGTSAPSSGACTAGQVLAASSSCNLLAVSSFLPTSAGAVSQTLTVTPQLGTAGSGAITGTAASLMLSSPTLACGSAVGVGSSVACGTLTVTANGASVSLGAAPISLTDSVNFALSNSTCGGGQVLPPGASCSVTVLFTPQSAGTKNLTLTANSNYGSPTATAAGTAVYGALTASPAAMSCGSARVGSSVACGTGSVTLTASGGAVVLGASAFSLTDSADFAVSAGGCSNLTLLSGQSCTTGSISFQPQAAGNFTSTVNVTTIQGSGTSFALNGSGVSFTANTASIPCTSAVGVGLTGSCGVVTLTANGGSVTLGSTPIALADPVNFALSGNTCSANKVLTANSTCSVTVQFAPQSGGTKNTSMTVNSNFGNPVITTSGTAVYGSLTVSPSALACGTVAIGASAGCGSGILTFTASAGEVIFGSTPFSISDATNFSVPPGSCANASLLAGQSCSSGTVAFTPQSAGSLSAVVSATPLQGSPVSVSLSGSGVWGTPTLSSTVSCPTIGAGLSAPCSGTATLTALGGPVLLNASPVALSNVSDFAIGSSSCSSSLLLAAGQSCAVSIVFTPQNVGSATSTLTLTTNNGTLALGLTGAGAVGQLVASASNVSCPSSTVGASLACGIVTLSAQNGPVTLASSALISSDADDFALTTDCEAGQTLPSGATCSVSVAFKPSAAGTLNSQITANTAAGTGASFTVTGIAYTYIWQQGGFGACTGGSGTWSYSTWAPTSGCGMTSQSRTGTCVATAGSGTATRAVTCVRSDGATVADANCIGTKPSTSQSCTPATGFSCDAEDSLTQSALLTDSCTYSWQTSDFGTCAGGTGTWNYSSWGPLSGCGVVSQARTAVCTADTNTGSQSRMVSCLRSDGATVQESLCDPQSQPAASQSCTATQLFSCGPQDTLTRAVTLSNGCHYGWVSDAWGTCTGGAGAWQYTAWIPAVGSACTSSLTQTRSAACGAVPNSGVQSRNVRCQDQNGLVVDATLCSDAPPATAQTCTPQSGFSCADQTVLLQTVSDLSTCSYSWSTGAWSACTGGIGTWQYSSWSPSCGVGTTTQTRSGTCVVNPNAGTQTRAVICTRSDGSVAPADACAGSAPATTQSCTNSSCGLEAPLAQKATLTKPCTK